MGIVGEQISREEEEVLKLLISVICLYGKEGLPFKQVEEEFLNMCGFPIPWKYFGAADLRSWILTLPCIYLLKNRYNEDMLHEYSPKSEHIQELITKQKRSHGRYICPREDALKRKSSVQDIWEDDGAFCANNFKKRLEECENQVLHEDSFIHTSVNSVASIDCERYEKFEQLESMLPLFYKHQALGDDFFVDIADTKLGYYVSEKGPKQTGLCSVGQTIAELTKKVRQAENLAPRVVVMIGFQDLLQHHSISKMITDLRQLVIELKKKNTRVTLLTLIPSPKLPESQLYETRRDIYNRAILEYGSDRLWKCNVIDMNTIFAKECHKFKRDFDRFYRVAKTDPYKVFSDYGRKVFLNALRSCLKQQIEYGH